MVRAVKGMIAEKAGIFLSFILCLIAFQFITLAATWASLLVLLFVLLFVLRPACLPACLAGV